MRQELNHLNRDKEIYEGIKEKNLENLPGVIQLSIKDGQIQFLSEEENKEREECLNALNNNPSFWEVQIACNKLKAALKSKREGYA